ncbi:hypothetical protein Sango_0366900 [Sesamum angolense]|uniref:Uncharacterized protein n=1 Tax=Sesamum angolense TaxID=2727404 RepID=A0AAE1X9L9_9LAMI|nr:hypothetical protein Sango_0366900 [Sesamum angolense]
MDIVGLFSLTTGQFLLVAIDYFIKWVETEPLARIIEGRVMKFIWKNIIYYFGLPREMISEMAYSSKDEEYKTDRKVNRGVGVRISLAAMKPTPKGDVGRSCSFSGLVGQLRAYEDCILDVASGGCVMRHGHHKPYLVHSDGGVSFLGGSQDRDLVVDGSENENGEEIMLVAVRGKQQRSEARDNPFTYERLIDLGPPLTFGDVLGRQTLKRLLDLGHSPNSNTRPKHRMPDAFQYTSHTNDSYQAPSQDYPPNLK